MTRQVLAFVPAVLLAVCFARESNRWQEPPAVSAISQVSFGEFVPVGGVILWWGIEDDIPLGYELCDGKFPAKGATLKERKPDLRDRFVKGARDFSSFRPVNATVGGRNTRGDLTTQQHMIAVNELPKHTHPIAHTHTLQPHDHRIGNHVHPIGQFVAMLLGSGPGTADLLQKHASPAPDVSEPAPTSNTGPSAILTTDAPSTPNSGVNAWTSGSQVGHSHVLQGGENMPAFLEMVFLIRVQ